MEFDTWRAIEEENGTQEKPKYPSRRRPLSQDEICEAIDNGIAQLVLDWNRKMLPKRELNVYSIWQKANRKNKKKKLLLEYREHINRINNDRLAKMRKEIASEVWTDSRQVLNQTRIMEQSIFDREDLAWKISILGQ